MIALLRLVYRLGGKKYRKLMARLKTAAKRRRSSYSEKVAAGTHPYKYPFPTGVAYREWRERHNMNSPPGFDPSDQLIPKGFDTRSRRRRDAA